MRKLGWIFIGAIFIGMLWTILALAVPAVGTGTRAIFFDIVGPGVVNGAIGISNSVMTFGTVGFPQAMAVFFGIGILWLVMGIGFSRLIWPRLPLVHKKAVVVQTPLQSQLSTPDLYVQKTAPVEQKVEVKAEEAK